MVYPQIVTFTYDWRWRGKGTEIISFHILAAPLSHREEDPEGAVKAVMSTHTEASTKVRLCWHKSQCCLAASRYPFPFLLVTAPHFPMGNNPAPLCKVSGIVEQNTLPAMVKEMVTWLKLSQWSSPSPSLCRSISGVNLTGTHRVSRYLVKHYFGCFCKSIFGWG